jgi:hypothetical protein
MIVPLSGEIAAALTRSAPRVMLSCTLSCACALVVAASAARAQTAPPAAAPIFAPGLYETESRNLSLPGPPVKSTVCIALADYAAFRAKTMADYRNGPQIFKQDCRLGDDTAVANGFTLSMQCQGVKSVLTWAFEKDMVRLTILTLMGNAPKPVATILTTMRRTGDCPAAK